MDVTDAGLSLVDTTKFRNWAAGWRWTIGIGFAQSLSRISRVSLARDVRRGIARLGL